MHPSYTSTFPELGFYGLPGHSRTPRDILKQAQDAEALGIGNIMISERADYKEISALCGAVAAVTENIYIGTSGTNLNTRHPVITASMGSTLNSLSEGRFALGLAKGVGLRWKAMNVDFPTFEREAEFIAMMRKLWRGERELGHQSVLGQYPALHLADYVSEDIPVLYVGFGPKSLQQAGRVYDGAHLHTFMSDQALSEAVAHFRAGEAETGRSGGKLWSVFATACDVSEERYLKLIVARLATYLQIPGYGEALVNVNGWDMDTLQAFRNAPIIAGMTGAIDSVASYTELAEIDKLIPQEWRPAAVGDAKTCAQRWLDQINAGADGVIIHASTPEEFAPVLAEYEKIRPSELFAQRTNRPG
ncbi:MAG: TIGR03857 family LLM class F420-dependent oxidoreductase [Gammaproteobacteria bacterium]|jgi:probable F420-dependent oxidoreductase|nr:TIGR03857 family LLM class F420-dependent oxidoreductase [Gammaproteobacteria bacterium]MBP73325.1 TIGR03857 family LLM class F420-dependent oxidoreductase [Gammaproteobacteria bacterium]|tara:strand:+ start:10308 stop:11390 length:1083 start_codon:yes stop_codon:yes gene_type:complete